MVLRIGSDSGSDRPGSDWDLSFWYRIIILRKAPESDAGFVNGLYYTSKHAYFRLSFHYRRSEVKYVCHVSQANVKKNISESTEANFYLQQFSFIFSSWLEFFSPSWWATLPPSSFPYKSSSRRHGCGTKCIARIKRFRSTWYEMLCISLIPFEV